MTEHGLRSIMTEHGLRVRVLSSLRIDRQQTNNSTVEC